VVARFTETLGPDNVNTGIARIKLGRALVRQQHYSEAAIESRAGYDILIRQTSPSNSYLRAARNDLVAEYDALKQPDQAAKFRSELTAAAK
jgi:eukaryotic-like serine/threonine-protein kinase